VPDFFHVDRDRDRALQAGAELVLSRRPDLAGDVARRFDAEHGGGLGPFGHAYVFGAGVKELVLTEQEAKAVGVPADEVGAALNRSTNRLIELIWELVRLAWFRDRPNRLRTVFGYRDVESASACRTNTFGNDTAHLAGDSL
jgi:hypothetical protein